MIFLIFQKNHNYRSRLTFIVYETLPLRCPIRDRSSSTSSKYQNIPTENFHRLCQLFVTICSKLFREVIKFRVKDLRAQLDGNKRILKDSNILFASQKEILYPSSKDKHTNLKEMDLSLLYILLRNICNIMPPVNNWGDTPLTTDRSFLVNAPSHQTAPSCHLRRHSVS